MSNADKQHDPLAPFVVEEGKYHDEGWVVWNPKAANGWLYRVVVDHKSQALQMQKALNKRVEFSALSGANHA